MNFRRFIVPTLIAAAVAGAGVVGVQQAQAHHAFAAEFDDELMYGHLRKEPLK